MRVIYGFDSIPAISHAVATVGSYDGVHSGHRVLIEQVIARAKARGGDSVVVTFEPHPRITLGKAEGLKLLTTLEEKALLLERLGVDFMVVIPFDLAFSRLSHQQFIEQYLIGKLGIEELVVGYNHHFGHNKSGDYNYLTSQQPTLAVYQVEQQLVESSKVSSTVTTPVPTTEETALAAIRGISPAIGHMGDVNVIKIKTSPFSSCLISFTSAFTLYTSILLFSNSVCSTL